MPSTALDAVGAVTSAPGAGSAPAGLSWHEIVDGPTQSAGTRFDDIVAWTGGFAMLESRQPDRTRRRTLAIWRSADGRSWTRTDLPRLGGRILGMQPYRDGLIIGVELTDPDPRRMQVDIWRSSDAATWRRVGSVRGRVPDALRSPWWIGAETVIVAGDRLGLIGRLSRVTGAGGWSPSGPQLAGVSRFAIRAPQGPDRLVGWTSTTGTRWTRAPVTGVTDKDGPIGPGSVGQIPGAAQALRGGSTPRLMTSRDGLTWVDVAPLPSGSEEGSPAGLLWADGASVLAMDSDGAGRRALDVWRLAPDGGWVASVDARPASAFGGAAEASDVILVGQSTVSILVAGGQPERPWAWVLVSRDGARTWDGDLSGSAALDTCFRSVAIHAGIAVMIACNRNLTHEPRSAAIPVIWSATLPAER